MFAKHFFLRKPARLKNREEQLVYYITETWMMLGKVTGLGFLVTISFASSYPWFIQLFTGWLFVTILLICLSPFFRFLMCVLKP